MIVFDMVGGAWASLHRGKAAIVLARSHDATVWRRDAAVPAVGSAFASSFRASMFHLRTRTGDASTLLRRLRKDNGPALV